jgi:hypothetical protein
VILFLANQHTQSPKITCFYHSFCTALPKIAQKEAVHSCKGAVSVLVNERIMAYKWSLWL